MQTNQNLTFTEFFLPLLIIQVTVFAMFLMILSVSDIIF